MPKILLLDDETAGQFVRRTVLNPKKISITAAAKLLDVGRPALSNFLNGKAAISKDMAARIERAFGISAQKLLDLQAAHDAVAAQTKGPPQGTRKYVPPFLGIKALEIEAWASNISSRVRLSVLLRTLVHSTGMGLTRVDFPGNDDAERPGWDGFAVASQGIPWIPEGPSGWEFGTNQDPKAKADSDYSKRVKATSKEERANTHGSKQSSECLPLGCRGCIVVLRNLNHRFRRQHETESVRHAGMPGRGAGHLRSVVRNEHAVKVVAMQDRENANHVDIAFIDESFAIVRHFSHDIA